MTSISLEKKYDYVLYYYVRNNLLLSKKKEYPSILHDVLMKFIGDLFIKFNICHQRYIECIKDNGFKIIRNEYLTDESEEARKYNLNSLTAMCPYQDSRFLIGSNCGFMSGINEWTIIINSQSYQDGIGITNSLDLCKKKK
eukprot:529049_1